jgi:hypothetical protein
MATKQADMCASVGTINSALILLMHDASLKIHKYITMGMLHHVSDAEETRKE